MESALSGHEGADEDQVAGQLETEAFLSPGTRRFGDFELLEEIGRGGMGVVYKARQLSLHRIVAVKMLLSGAFAGTGFIRRFQGEAEAAAELHHPNIVAIHDFGECEGQYYFCMDYVPGRNLAEVVKEGPLPPAQAARYVRMIASAIGYAHAHGILHRDLKPSNIIIDSDDNPRITDFGLAKRMTLEDDMTLSGQAIGSPNYMPPEQATGQRDAIGPASDVFSIGAMLYHLLTGRPPFLSDTVTSTLRQVQEAEPVSLRLLNVRVSRDLETICLKCLEKDPRRRYSTAEELEAELDRTLRGEPIRTRPVGPLERTWRWCRRNPRLSMMAGAVVLLGLALLIGIPWAVWRIERQRQLADAALSKLEIERAQDWFAADRAAEGTALLASLVRQRPKDRALAEWLMNELTYRSFAMPTFEGLGHDDMVFYAQFSPDGRRLLTVCRDNTARVWDSSTGRPITPPLRHDASLIQPGEFLGPTQPLCARWSPDGTRVVTASIDRTALVWDAATGRPVTPPLVHNAGFACAQFHRNGQWVVTGTDDGEVRFWDVATGQPTGPVLRHASRVSTLEFSPDGEWLVTGSDDGTSQVWEARTGQTLGPRLRHVGEVRGVCFSPNGKMIATVASDNTARVWTALTGEPVTPLLQHADTVNTIQFSPDGLWVVTSSWDKGAHIWNARTGQPFEAALRHRGTVRSAAFSPEGLRVVTASEDGTARVWDARTGRPLTEPIAHNGAVWWAAFAPDGWRIVTASLDGTARVWDVRSRRAVGPTISVAASPKQLDWSPQGDRLLGRLGRMRVRSMDLFDEREALVERKLGHLQNVNCACYNPDATRVVTASADQTVRIWDEKTERFLVLQHRAVVSSARFSADGTRVVTAARDGSVRIWDAMTGQACGEPFWHSNVVYDAAFSRDGRWIVTASADRQARLWDPRSGKLLGPPFVHTHEVTAAIPSPDSGKVLTVASDNAARLWSVRSGKMLGAPMSHDGLINSARFSPDGRWIVTASRDKTGRVWDAHTGRPVTEPLVHEGAVNVADFSPDGRRVVTASDDGTVRVWDARTGVPRSPPLQHKLGVLAAQFHPSGLWIAAGSADYKITLWDFVPVPPRVPAGLPSLAEAVVGGRFNQDRRFEHVGPGEFLRLKRELLLAPTSNGDPAWVKWFFEDPLKRHLSPSSQVGTRWAIGKRVDRAWLPDPEHVPKLEEALLIAPDDEQVVAQLAQMVARYGPTNLATRLALVDAYSRRAVTLQPEDPMVWWSRAVYFELLGDTPAALDAMERAAEFGSDNAYFWMAKGSLFEKVGRLDVALDAFNRAVQVVEPMDDWPRSSKNYLALVRADFLDRHGWTDEARRARLRTHGIVPRDPAIPSRLIDLWTVYNAGLAETATGQPGELDLGAYPDSIQNLVGVPFHIAGAVRLASPVSGGRSPPFPNTVTNIPVHQICRCLHLLHAADTAEADGTTIGAYAVCYADGTSLEIPIIYGKDVLAWNLDPPRTNAPPVVAWSGHNRKRVPVQLFKSTWENPRPEAMIETLEFYAGNAKAAPFLVAITAEAFNSAPHRGSVE